MSGNELRATGNAAPTPLHQGTDYTEPCVGVEKMREFGDAERFDLWCVKHHHWLNGSSAGSVTDAFAALMRKP